MSDNIDIRDGYNIARILRATDTAGVHTPHHIIDASALPTGAATEAKQPAIGVAGTAAADVLTIQGITGMTPINVTLPSIPAGSATIGNVGIVGTVPVSGTFWQATQPVSAAAWPLPTGAATDRVTAASPFSVRLTDGTEFYNAPSSGQLPSALVGGRLDTNNGAWLGSTAPTVGQKTMANAIPVAISSDQSAIPVTTPSVLFSGMSSTFRIPGRAGTTGQNLLTLHNASGSTVTVRLTDITVDMYCTVVKAITVAPPLLRLWKITALPSGGTVIAKNKVGGTSTSNGSVVVTCDASADGTNSATPLGTTRPAGTFLATVVSPRFITAAGYDMTDIAPLAEDESITLAAGEGVAVFLDYTLATQNPTTDMWVVNCEWAEA